MGNMGVYGLHKMSTLDDSLSVLFGSVPAPAEFYTCTLCANSPAASTCQVCSPKCRCALLILVCTLCANSPSLPVRITQMHLIHSNADVHSLYRCGRLQMMHYLLNSQPPVSHKCSWLQMCTLCANE